MKICYCLEIPNWIGDEIMTENSEILEKVANIFREIFDDTELMISRETSAIDIDDWDSFEQISLVVAIEKKFNIKFGVMDTINLKNVGDMIDLIELKLSQQEKEA